MAWDNYDVNVETFDGKNTLHSTVGICYQNSITVNGQAEDIPIEMISGRKRRSFQGNDRTIPAFNTSLKNVKFQITKTSTSFSNKVTQMNIDFIWLLKTFTNTTPLYYGYLSRYVTDDLPCTVVTYMDPISLPPTRNDVVCETMVRSLRVSEEMKQKYAIVTYDLAVALKAYSIQAVQTPKFDNLIILLGNFHIELAFFGAVGTFIADFGAEHLLTESGVLAEGSLNGFLKGKFYNRCARIHQLLATALEKELFVKYLEQNKDDKLLATSIMK